MLRYHKKVYFPDQSEQSLKAFTDRLNGLAWGYSRHCLDNLKYRAVNMQDILLYIKDIKLDWKDIFEYYLNNDIDRAVYRVKYNQGIDICLVISKDKNIVTIYLNTTDDKHYTLNKEVYQRE